MASTLRKLTGMGGDVRKIAALLQAKAPAGHKLAYINDEEAALLKSRGGSGKPHADTGIPSFEIDYSFAPDESAAETGRLQAAEDRIQATRYSPQTATQEDLSFGPGKVPEGVLIDPNTGQSMPTRYEPSGISAPTFFRESGVYSPAQGSAQVGVNTQIPSTPYVATSADRAALFGDRGYGSAASPAELAAATEAPKPEKGVLDKISETTGLSKDTLGKLGLSGGLGLVAAYSANKAKEKAEKAKAEQQALATPYQQAGAQMQAQAQRGELTPQAQQSLQAVQAQAAQQAERRGGVGQAQMQAQVEAFRQQLLSQQYDYGLKLSGIGDNIALGAIKTGLQADQYVQQLTNNYFTNIARTAYGAAPQVTSDYRYQTERTA